MLLNYLNIRQQSSILLEPLSITCVLKKLLKPFSFLQPNLFVGTNYYDKNVTSINTTLLILICT